MDSAISVSLERYLGIDLRKHYVVIGRVNTKQAIVLRPAGSISTTGRSERRRI